jgi:hypothetical protein
MSNAEVDDGISPELLISAREAGKKCLQAFKELAEAAMKPAEDPLQDYRPLLFALFAALRNGWAPISRRWPKLRMDDASTTYVDRVDIDWRTVTPPSIWLLARNLFWQIVWHTNCRGPASHAWIRWLELRLPPDGSGIWEPRIVERRGMTWSRIRLIVADCSLPNSWDDASAAISNAPAGDQKDLRDLPESLLRERRPMPYLIPPKPLPSVLEKLEELLREANELVAYYLDCKLKCSKIATAYVDLLKMATMDQCRGFWGILRSIPGLSPEREVTDYALPIEIAACNFAISPNYS